LHPSTPQTSLPQFMIIITLFILWFILWCCQYHRLLSVKWWN
jgi:hypothetical protein